MTRTHTQSTPPRGAARPRRTARTVTLARCADTLERLRAQRPLVQCLTNTVTTNLVANVLIALGASPAMVDIPGEAGPFAHIADAVLINLGTPGAEQRAAMREAVAAADRARTPWVLDPVAVGVLPVRTALARDLSGQCPAVIRGNASEICALAGQADGARGVDAVHEVDAARTAADELAARAETVIAVSGPVDLVTDGARRMRVANGSPLLTQITGAGCALGGVVAACAAVTSDPLTAATAASVLYGVAGELAAERTRLPGSFAVELLDCLALLDPETVVARGRLT